MNDTAIVTCFYTNLHGTKYGGREGRHSHYIHSLESLLKITKADFFIYCDPIHEEELKEVSSRFSDTSVTIIPYDLEDFYMKPLFEEYKNFDEASTSQRCQEIQYLKSYWMNIVEEHKWVFWIDVGISYSGLFPDKHMIVKEGHAAEYYNTSLISNDLLDGLKNAADDKFLMFAIHNSWPILYRYYLEDFPPQNTDPSTHHAIAGIMGGKRRIVQRFHSMFNNLAIEIGETCKLVHDEEVIYHVAWDRNPDFFNVLLFDCWWHEDNAHSIYREDVEMIEVIKSMKSFYKVLEDLIGIGKNHG